MHRLHNTVKKFEWGSTDAIPAILGTVPDGTPCAELWLGAHPVSPSRLDVGHTRAQAPLERQNRLGGQQATGGVATEAEPRLGPNLIEYLAGDPEGLLGHDSLESFGARLPFLLKVLSARKALSIQVHPNREQARAGFAAEEAAGPALDAPDRNFKDASAKPELIYALTDFHALTGFRPRKAVRATFERMLSQPLTPPSLDVLGAIIAALKSFSESKALSRAVEIILSDPRTPGLVDEVAARGIDELPVGHISRSGSAVDPAQTFCELVTDYPHDPGALVGLMLNRVHLQPGEALTMDAGVLHAYLFGTGIEIMASSDNVVRGGLTSKHVDIEQLSKITDFHAGAPRMVEPDHSGMLLGPTDDFALQALRCPRMTTVERRGAAIVLCTAGTVTLSSLGSTLTLERGQSAFIAANEPTVTADGHGDLFVATTGLNSGAAGR
ncbi:mannose-6-phosphate isomerase, type 1 [Brevibacterium iodinum ATCC 49514]|uniref:mannose-6-phosphate isomerase n=1 Tax=Brevibacterium iodinum ATCC 49514 TaxID=1255616 RepID=A0A2H1JN11_9MICO|nr:mannose-6-phosphate isomerase, class I [Brevibacterium iodinum]SMX88688.1 mannose-6-phosphate isomerase, type 1 [Brevibacterium iodinum ATCC 49514]SUW11965.1 Mannose-6-phosphate isomerase [Brevibacterium iodinum]